MAKKAIVLTLFFLFFYTQDRYAIFCIDDWMYSFVVQEDAKDVLEVLDDGVVRQPVLSFEDAVVSQSRDYFKTNGRFVVHTVVQYLCGVWGMDWFVVFNSVVFLLLIILMVQFLRTDGRSVWWHWLLVFSAVWLLMPHKGMTFLGRIALSVNYLWVSVATLLFVMVFERLRRHGDSRPLVLIGYVLFAFVAGSLQESFCIGVSGALFVYLLYKRGRAGRGLTAVSLAYMLGAMVCVLSPANFGRADDIGGFGFHTRVLLGLASSPPILLSIVLMFLLWRKGLLRRWVAENHLLLASAAFNLLFVLFVAYNGRHQLTAINVMLLVVLLKVWAEGSIGSPRLRKAALVTMVVVTIVSYWPILQVRKSYYDCYQGVVERARQTTTGFVDGREFEDMRNRIKANLLVDVNYVETFTFNGWDVFEQGLSVWLTHGESNNFVTTVLPEDSLMYYKGR